jgi:predicted TIM-barrel fold metal-dependent hydrolase
MKNSWSASRRGFLRGIFSPAMLPAAAAAQTGTAARPEPSPKIYLNEYQPKSMLVVPEHRITRAKFPLIDVHTHVSRYFGMQAFGADAVNTPEPADIEKPREEIRRIVSTMDQLNLKMLLNLTGGTGPTLARNIRELPGRHQGRFLVCTEPSYQKYADEGYPKWQADELERAKRAGAVGLKVIKSLGLVLRERITEGPLVKIDDPRFDPMWRACGELNLPVFIHISDPDAFFTPIDRFNERYDELQRRPEWSFYGKDFPKKAELLAQRNRVIERHPKTTFVCLHVANHPENLGEVSSWLRRYPNMQCEVAARISELGRQPRQSQKFFDEFQDRIMFGTDVSGGLGPGLYGPYFRFFETLDEYFDYAGGPIPPQGRWKIYGIGLNDSILKKVYYNNAARLLHLAAI